MAVVLPNGRNQFFASDGSFLSGGKVYAYVPGTSTPKDTYTTSVGSVANTNPVVLNTRGEAAIYWNGTYDVLLKTAADVTVWGPERLYAPDLADWLTEADLASTASVSLGDALVGVKRTDSGAVARTQHDKNEESVSVKDFGAIGDGVADDRAAIQAALDAHDSVYLPQGTYKITAALSVTDKKRLHGDGSTSSVISTSVNTVNAIEITSDARRVILSRIGIVSAAGVGASNAAIKMNLTLGPAQSVFEDLRILTFFYGIQYGDRFWDSTVRNVRCDSCSYGAYSTGTAGTNINVIWDRFYSEEHLVTGFNVASCFTYLLNACNFGGEQGGGQSQALVVTSNAALKAVSCNFESHLVAADTGVVNISSTAKVTLEDCTWSSNDGASANGYALALKNSATAIVSNCKDFAGGSNWSQIYISDTASLTKMDDGLAAVNHASGSSAGSVVHSPYQSRQYRSDIIDLSGAAVTKVIYVPKRNGRVTRIAVIYTEASSANAGITITVRSDDSTFTYASFTSHTSQALHDVQEITLASSTVVSSSRPVIVSSPGGKTGTGEISIIFECDED